VVGGGAIGVVIATLLILAVDVIQHDRRTER